LFRKPVGIRIIEDLTAVREMVGIDHKSGKWQGKVLRENNTTW